MMHFERDAVKINGWRTWGPRLLIHSCSPFGGGGGRTWYLHWLGEGATHTNRRTYGAATEYSEERKRESLTL